MVMVVIMMVIMMVVVMMCGHDESKKRAPSLRFHRGKKPEKQPNQTERGKMAVIYSVPSPKLLLLLKTYCQRSL